MEKQAGKSRGRTASLLQHRFRLEERQIQTPDFMPDLEQDLPLGILHSFPPNWDYGEHRQLTDYLEISPMGRRGFLI